MNPHEFWTSQYNHPRRAHHPVNWARPEKNPTRKPKVIRVISVQSPESERVRSNAAARIQRIFRGYRVRRSVRKIKEIAREVEELEKRVEEKETLERIRNEEKERLRWNEMLMGFLLRLDGVRGVDDGVRVCRKLVTRRVVALQERVDSIVEERDLGSEGLVEENKNEDQIGGVEGPVEARIDDSGEEVVKVEEKEDDMETTVEDGLESDEIKDSEGLEEENHHVSQIEENDDVMQQPGVNAGVATANVQEESKADGLEMADGDKVESEECPDVVEGDAVGFLQDDWVSLSNREGDVNVMVDPNEYMDHRLGTECALSGNVDSEMLANSKSLVDDNEAKGEDEMQQPMSEEKQLDDATLVGENKRNRELLEKMMEENEKMMDMMTHLFEKSEKQTQMLSSLTKRVQILEKAFICDLLRRKKKKSLP
ncbi:hypothetical protein Droror1_Dr00011524 [Drosera rotundifolia]